MAERVQPVAPVGAPEAEAGVRDLAPVEGRAPGPRPRERSPAAAVDLAPVDLRGRAPSAPAELAPTDVRDRSPAAPADVGQAGTRDRAAGERTPEDGRAEAGELREAVAGALTATPLEQRAAAERINALLAALTPVEANGRALLELLDTAALTGLVDDAGRDCRREAVRALLRLGFPWALEIEPETLAWFRQVEARGPRRLRALAVLLAALTALGGGLGWYSLAAHAPPQQVEPAPRQPPATKLQSWEAPPGR